MPPPEPDLDQLTTLLGRCLGRIEEQAFRLQHDDDADDDPGIGDAFDDETAMLQDLMESLLATTTSDHADLNATIERAVQSCLGEIDIPIVVRQRLAKDLPKVACTPGQLAFAVQRALMLGLGRLEPGDEVVLTTRRDDGAVLFELESCGTQDDRHLRDRTETLAEFVSGFQGNCRVQTRDERTLLLVLELPVAFVPDRH